MNALPNGIRLTSLLSGDELRAGRDHAAHGRDDKERVNLHTDVVRQEERGAAAGRP